MLRKESVGRGWWFFDRKPLLLAAVMEHSGGWQLNILSLLGARLVATSATMRSFQNCFGFRCIVQVPRYNAMCSRQSEVKGGPGPNVLAKIDVAILSFARLCLWKWHKKIWLRTPVQGFWDPLCYSSLGVPLCSSLIHNSCWWPASLVQTSPGFKAFRIVRFKRPR